MQNYDYPLPVDKIAHYPLPRGESKLLIANDQELKEGRYKNLVDYLPPHSWLVLNETKVVQARLLFPKNEQSLIEVFCLEPAEGMSVEEAMQQQYNITYRCMVGGARKWKEQALQISTPEFKLTAEKLSRTEGTFTVRLSWPTEHSFGEILELAGKTPLPPYIKRAAEESDRQSYQTVFASRPGSVAAPTAGLHFNDTIFQSLAAQGIGHSRLTLHVGAGTFKPVASDDISEHEMHAEEVQLELSFLEDICQRLASGRAIIPVGTTALRALESIYWLACIMLHQTENDFSEPLTIPQWIGFDDDIPALSPIDAYSGLAEKMRSANRSSYGFKTRLIIAPGYQHRIISALITNFHQPKSTLLLLIASLLGEQWKGMYHYALEHNFRFLSYGDGCLILNNGA